MSTEINEVKVLLAEIAGEIALSEEKLKNKMTKEDYLLDRQKLISDIAVVDKRLTGIYIKVILTTTGLVGLLELLIGAIQ